MNPYPEVHLDTNAKIAFSFLEPHMLAHHKMKKIYEQNYDMLMVEHKKYIRENGGIDFSKDFIPYVYHIGINEIKLDSIERLQFEIYVRELEYNLFSYDIGHIHWFTDLLFALVAEFVDPKIIERERIELIRDSGKCAICEKFKNRCKGHKDDDWE